MSKKHSIVFFAALAVVYYAVLQWRTDKKDSAFFGGDTWEYQSMGVNFAKGHGIQKFGAMEPFDVYKFEKTVPLPATYYRNFISGAGKDDFFRTPAYPLFLGVAYKLFGVSPRAVKIIQLLMLVFIAASLPFLGRHYWGKPGFIGGVPAGLLYLKVNHSLAGVILTETLITAAVFIVLIAFLVYERQRRTLPACFLGVSLGCALLVKGSLIFLPLLTWGVLLTLAVLHRDPGGLKRLLVIIVSTILTVLPWSVYASVKSGGVIVLSTQGGYQLLTDNNEFCTDGGWHPEWIDKNDSWYNSDGIDTLHPLAKVINFYRCNTQLLPRFMFQKFYHGFWPMRFLWIFIGFALFDGICRIACRFTDLKIIRLVTTGPPMRVPTPMWVVAGNFLLVTLVFHAEFSIVPSRFVAPMDFVFALLCCVSAANLFMNIFRNISVKQAVGETGRGGPHRNFLGHFPDIILSEKEEVCSRKKECLVAMPGPRRESPREPRGRTEWARQRAAGQPPVSLMQSCVYFEDNRLMRLPGNIASAFMI